VHKIWCTCAVYSVTKLHQSRYVTPNKRTWKISTSIQLHGILCMGSQEMVLYCCIAILQLLYSPRNYW
jgi:hypothetical protein